MAEWGKALTQLHAARDAAVATAVADAEQVAARAIKDAKRWRLLQKLAKGTPHVFNIVDDATRVVCDLVPRLPPLLPAGGAPVLVVSLSVQYKVRWYSDSRSKYRDEQVWEKRETELTGVTVDRWDYVNGECEGDVTDEYGVGADKSVLDKAVVDAIQAYMTRVVKRDADSQSEWSHVKETAEWCDEFRRYVSDKTEEPDKTWANDHDDPLGGESTGEVDALLVWWIGSALSTAVETEGGRAVLAAVEAAMARAVTSVSSADAILATAEGTALAKRPRNKAADSAPSPSKRACSKGPSSDSSSDADSCSGSGSSSDA